MEQTNVYVENQEGINNIKIKDMLGNWNVFEEGVKQIYSSAWQVGDRYVLKTGKNLVWLKRNMALIKALTEQGVPVATVIKTNTGEDYLVEEDSYFFLSRKIEGEHIADIYAEDYKATGYIIGEVIGKMHIAFCKCQEEISCYNNNFFEEITGWVSSTFRDKNITSVPEKIMEECIFELKEIYPTLPRQLIHRDIHLGNLLFQNKVLTGYIDFDLTQISAKVFDLCYMALSFLIDNTKDKEKTTKWFEVLSSMLQGYSSILPLSTDEINAIPTMMISIEMLFVAYFTKTNEKENANGAAEMLIWLWENKDKI